MRIILNDHGGTQNVATAIAELARGADTLSVAVSYLQRGGWELFRRRIRRLDLARMRIVCTDQLGITQPTAVQSALNSRVQVRNFTGGVTYHPKVYLAHDGEGRPTRFLLGSANMSFSAYTHSTEACVLGDDPIGLQTLSDWFNDLFQNRSERFTPARLRRMEENWRAAASQRTRRRLRVRRGLAIPAEAVAIEAEDLNTLDDVFSTLQTPIGTLNIDYAGNNIRNLAHVREVLQRRQTAWTAKQSSELKLLGFALGGRLTALGREAARADTLEEIALLWCRWLQNTDDGELRRINRRLLAAKRVFPQFWRLRRDVRDFFLANATGPADPATVRTIELLCNAREIVQELYLADVRALSTLVREPQLLPEFVGAALNDYTNNKGARGWDYPDRRIIPQAWQRASAAG